MSQIATTTTAAKERATAPKKAAAIPPATITVDGVRFERSNVKGIYSRNDASGVVTATETAAKNGFVDFQIILNEDEFRELERRKNALMRLNQFNGVA